LLPWVFGILDPQTIEAYSRIEGRFLNWRGQKKTERSPSRQGSGLLPGSKRSIRVGSSGSQDASTNHWLQFDGGGLKIGLQGFWVGSWTTDYYPR
jgi:hypothetical protein